MDDSRFNQLIEPWVALHSFYEESPERAGAVVARVVSGDGYDPATGSVTLRAGGSPVLTFQVTANLERNTTVEIEVLDARTGVRLGGADLGDTTGDRKSIRGVGSSSADAGGARRAVDGQLLWADVRASWAEHVERAQWP